MSARPHPIQATEDWRQAVLERAIDLLKVAVLQGRSSVAFQVVADRKPLDLVASLAPAWSLTGDEGSDELVPHVCDGAQGVRLCVFLGSSGGFLVQSKPMSFAGGLVPGPQVPLLGLPSAWAAEGFAGVAAWCWGAVVAALQAGQVQAAVSLPLNGQAHDTAHVELRCTLAVEPVGSGFFLAVTHARTGAVIGCSALQWPDSLDADVCPNFAGSHIDLDA